MLKKILKFVLHLFLKIFYVVYVLCMYMYKYTHTYMYVYVCVYVCASVHMWRSEDNLVESILFFHFYVGGFLKSSSKSLFLLSLQSVQALSPCLNLHIASDKWKH